MMMTISAYVSTRYGSVAICQPYHAGYTDGRDMTMLFARIPPFVHCGLLRNPDHTISLF